VITVHERHRQTDGHSSDRQIWTEKRQFIGLLLFPLLGDSANAVPHYQKLRARLTHIWGNRRGQPNRSAMEGPRPGGSASLITDSSAPGKYVVSAKYWNT